MIYHNKVLHNYLYHAIDNTLSGQPKQYSAQWEGWVKFPVFLLALFSMHGMNHSYSLLEGRGYSGCLLVSRYDKRLKTKERVQKTKVRTKKFHFCLA